MLLPWGARPGAARRYLWRRAAGLWLAVPAVVLIGAGVLVTFEHTLESGFGLDAELPELANLTSLGVPTAPIAPARALAFVSNLYAVHTGEALGPLGRGLAFTVAAWLVTMLVLGFGLWWARRGKRT